MATKTKSTQKKTTAVSDTKRKGGRPLAEYPRKGAVRAKRVRGGLCPAPPGVERLQEYPGICAAWQRWNGGDRRGTATDNEKALDAALERLNVATGELFSALRAMHEIVRATSRQRFPESWWAHFPLEYPVGPCPVSEHTAASDLKTLVSHLSALSANLEEWGAPRSFEIEMRLASTLAGRQKKSDVLLERVAEAAIAEERREGGVVATADSVLNLGREYLEAVQLWSEQRNMEFEPACRTPESELFHVRPGMNDSLRKKLERYLDAARAIPGEPLLEKIKTARDEMDAALRNPL